MPQKPCHYLTISRSNYCFFIFAVHCCTTYHQHNPHYKHNHHWINFEIMFLWTQSSHYLSFSTKTNIHHLQHYHPNNTINTSLSITSFSLYPLYIIICNHYLTLLSLSYFTLLHYNISAVSSSTMLSLFGIASLSKYLLLDINNSLINIFWDYYYNSCHAYLKLT